MTELSTPAAQPDPELTKDCNDPSQLTPTALAAGPVERDWGRDRVSLVECKKRHQDLRDFYKKRDAKLALTPNKKQ